MAIPTIPPGFGSKFNAAKFREAIRATMVMGLPGATPDAPTFRWNPKRTYELEDPGHNPYSWEDAPVTEVLREDVQIPCAVEFVQVPGASADTPIGQIDASRVRITILDEDYVDVEGADLVILGGNVYEIDFVAPPQGLFDVTVFTVFATARDES